jgi:hypothetical protein
MSGSTHHDLGEAFLKAKGAFSICAGERARIYSIASIVIPPSQFHTLNGFPLAPLLAGIQWACATGRAPHSNLENENEMYANAVFVIILVLAAALVLVKDAVFFKRTTGKRRRGNSREG